MFRQLQLKHPSDSLQARSKGNRLNHQQQLLKALILPTIIIKTPKTLVLSILLKNNTLKASLPKKYNIKVKLLKAKRREQKIHKCLSLSNLIQKEVEARCHFSLTEASFQITFRPQWKKPVRLRNNPRSLPLPLKLKKIIMRKVKYRPKQIPPSKLNHPRARAMILRRYKSRKSLYNRLEWTMLMRVMGNLKRLQPLLKHLRKKWLRWRWSNKKLQ